MLLEIICSNVLGLSVDLSRCSSAQLEKLQTLSGNQTAIFNQPVERDLIEEKIKLAKGRHYESDYRREADHRRRDAEYIRDRSYDRRRRLENDYYNRRYDRGRGDSIRNRRNDIDNRIEQLERERERLEDVDRRSRRRRFWYY